MACLRKLKDDISILESLFPKNHERLQVLVASVDEIALRFIDDTGRAVIINANILEDYPRQAPLWFSESDDAVICSALERLSSEGDQQNCLLAQIHKLISELCRQYNITVPSELTCLAPDEDDLKDEGHGSDVDTEDEEGEELVEVEIILCSSIVTRLYSIHFKNLVVKVAEVDMTEEEPHGSIDDDVSPEGKIMLEKITRSTLQQHLNGNIQGSVTATDRLMKEMRDIYKSEHFKNGVYSIELRDDDNLYEWWVKLYKVDSDSALYSDLVTLATEHKQDHILFHFLFNENFPCDPPFVRLVSPTAQYSLARAQQSFKSLVQIHAKSGWYTPPTTEG
ncbi:hypothetical protein DICVIV_11701 [Dictyocaulus viviparus]|uniref:UBC core domain-containing protein n=1 Tax=Dictyocaulus viviparus TaxID=29172 RepID=A0A0D8XF38_DICVI|nr:hypothetical protein DICVIV_11701 [Dictyocaulus viviparus]